MPGPKVKYDPQIDSLYLQFGDTPAKESDQNESGIMIDYDTQGNIVGVELPHVAARLSRPGWKMYWVKQG